MRSTERMKSGESEEEVEATSDVLEDYRKAHERGKQLLASSYGEEKFNSVMGSYLNASAELGQALDALEAKLAAAGSEEEKKQIRLQWLEEEDLWTSALAA